MVKFKIEGDVGEFPSEPATERDAILQRLTNGKYYPGFFRRTLKHI